MLESKLVGCATRYVLSSEWVKEEVLVLDEMSFLFTPRWALLYLRAESGIDTGANGELSRWQPTKLQVLGWD
jgi:hypothetical protein